MASIPNQHSTRSTAASPLNPSTLSHPTKRTAAAAMPARPIDWGTTLIFYIAVGIFSCFVFVIVSFAIISTKANASLFQRTKRSARAEDDMDALRSPTPDGAIACTRAAMQRLFEQFDRIDTDAPDSPAPSACTPELTTGPTASPTETSSTAVTAHDWLDWDWVREGQDELDELECERDGLGRSVPTTSTTYLSQSALMALDAMYNDTHTDHTYAALRGGSAPTPHPSPKLLQNGAGDDDDDAVGLGIYASEPLTPPSTPCPLTEPTNARPPLVRQSSYIRPGQAQPQAHAQGQAHGHPRAYRTLRPRPSCSSLSCECEVGERRLCTLSEEDEVGAADADGSSSYCSAGSLTPRSSRERLGVKVSEFVTSPTTPAAAAGAYGPDRTSMTTTPTTTSSSPSGGGESDEYRSRLEKLARSRAIRRMLRISRSQS